MRRFCDLPQRPGRQAAEAGTGRGQSLLTTIGLTLDDTLDGVTEPAELEPALVRSALRIATDWLDSAECTALQRLVRTGTDHLPDREDRALTDAPEEALGERFAPRPTPDCSRSPTPASPPITSSR